MLKPARRADRKSTRLNSSHLGISYAVFCLKKTPPTQRSPFFITAATPAHVVGLSLERHAVSLSFSSGARDQPHRPLLFFLKAPAAHFLHLSPQAGLLPV